MQGQRQLLILLFASLLAASTSFADLPAKFNVANQTLELNGAGKRTKTFITIYESGLYLPKPSRDAKAIVGNDELMAIRIQITSSFVSRSSLIKSLYESLKKSSGGNMDSIKNETKQFIKTLNGEVKKGDVYDFVHVPQRGLHIFRNKEQLGIVPGLAFKQALFGVWLSDSPVDTGLRQAMLSGGKLR